jgi:hypothetical protein
LTSFAAAGLPACRACGSSLTIVAAHVTLQAGNDQNGEGQNNRWHLVEKPLS